MISLIEFEGGGVPPEIPPEWLEGDWSPCNIISEILKDHIIGFHEEELE